MVDILIRRRQNNPILTGEAGVGKTAVVEGLARADRPGRRPAGAQERRAPHARPRPAPGRRGVKGEFENRLKQVIAEVKASPVPIILFIDEAHTMIGAGGQAGQSDAANLLKPALARGELRTIAATTWAEYKKYFEKDAALARRFQVVKVEEPDEDRAIRMMRGITGDAREAPRRADPRRGRRERRQALAPLHPRPAAPRQVGQPARYRLRPGGDRPERRSRRPSRTAAAGSTTSRSSSASSTARAPPAAATTSGSPSSQQALEEAAGPPRRARGPLGDEERERSRRSATWPRQIEALLRRGEDEASGDGEPAVPALRRADRPAGRPRSQDRRARASSRASRRSDAGLRRLADHRRGHRRLDGHPRRQDARRRDPDRAQPPGRSWRSASSASRTPWRRSPSGSAPRGPT